MSIVKKGAKEAVAPRARRNNNLYVIITVSTLLYVEYEVRTYSKPYLWGGLTFEGSNPPKFKINNY